jgi:hypothetical protein
MRLIIGWSVAIGLLWAVSILAIQSASLVNPELHLDGLYATLLKIGDDLGLFIKPLLQLGILLYILIAAAERLGFQTNAFTGALKEVPINVQAFIAVVIIVSFSIAALAGVGDVSALKDIALVVVGFYFGTRQRVTANGDNSSNTAQAQNGANTA